MHFALLTAALLTAKSILRILLTDLIVLRSLIVGRLNVLGTGVSRLAVGARILNVTGLARILVF